MKSVILAAFAALASVTVAQNVTNTTIYGYTCASNYSLTYGILVRPLPEVSLTKAVTFFSNWTGAAPGTSLSVSGTNATGATRTYNLAGTNYTVSEVLVGSTLNATTGSLHQTWNTTTPLSISGVNISAIYDDFTVYTNSTSNVTTIQWFVNLCTDSQSAVGAILPSILGAGVSFWVAGLSIPAPPMSASASSGSSSMMASSHVPLAPVPVMMSGSSSSGSSGSASASASG